VSAVLIILLALAGIVISAIAGSPGVVVDFVFLPHLLC